MKRMKQNLQTLLLLNCKKQQQESTLSETLSLDRKSRMVKQKTEVTAKAKKTDDS